MYCPNCGTDMKEDKFCTKCGYSNDSRNAVQIPKPSTPPKRSSKGGVAAIIIIVVLAILAFIVGIGLIIFFAFKTVTDFSTKEFINLDKFDIPSIYKVTGEKLNVCGIQYESDNLSITLCEPISDKKVKEYVDYLINKEGYTLYEGSYDYNLYKEEDGYVLYVIISNNKVFKYTYTYGDFQNDDKSIGV